MSGFSHHAGEDRSVFFIRHFFKVIDQVFQFLISFTVRVINRNRFPCVALNGIGICVYLYLKTSDLVSPDPGLYNEDVIHLCGRVQICVAVTADDDIHTPSGVKLFGKL